jgi:hypothetical protein
MPTWAGGIATGEAYADGVYTGEGDTGGVYTGGVYTGGVRRGDPAGRWGRQPSRINPPATAPANFKKSRREMSSCWLMLGSCEALKGRLSG